MDRIFSGTNLSIASISILILGYGLMIWAGLHGVDLYPSSHVEINPQSSEVQRVQNYCDALEKQDYARAFSYFDQSEGGAFVGSPSQTLSKSAFVNLARSVDQQGKVISCSIKNEVETQDPCLPGHLTVSCPPPTFVLTMQIIRSHHVPYSMHVEVEVDLWVTLIVSVDKL